MEYHEYANIFPMMSEADLKGLAGDISENGQRDPVIMYQEKILDGRNRYQACAMLGIDPIFTDYEGDDPLGFVMSHNLHRRHLTESQRAMVGARWAKLKHGGERGNQHVGGKSPIGDSTSETKTRQEAADILNVGTSSIDRAKSVLKNGVEELQHAVDRGEIKVNSAKHLAKLPHAEQREILAGGADSVKEAVKKLIGQSTRKSATSSPSAADSSNETDTQKQENCSTEEMTSPEDMQPLVVDGTIGSRKRRSPIRVIESEGINIWKLAKSHLDRINKHDEFREQALTECMKYCESRIKSKR